MIFRRIPRIEVPGALNRDLFFLSEWLKLLLFSLLSLLLLLLSLLFLLLFSLRLRVSRRAGGSLEKGI